MVQREVNPMPLCGKTKPEDICEHLRKVIKVLIENNIEMMHDFQGTDLYCPDCNIIVSLEAYGDKFTHGDLGEQE